MEESNLTGIRLMLVWDKLQSVNKMYVRTKSGMTMSPEARSFKMEVMKQVRRQLPKRLPFDRDDVLKLSLHFLLKERFFNRDTSNFIKLIEDTIFDELGINDARNIELDCRKSFIKGSKNEYIKVTIEKSKFDYDFFNKPESTEPVIREDLDDRAYTRDEIEKYYTQGLFDAMKWDTHLDPKIEKPVPKKTKK